VSILWNQLEKSATGFRKAKHCTFAERFVAFMAATLIFDTVNSCAADAFESIGVLCGLVEATHLAKKHTEVLQDFANFVHNELVLIHAASPLSIREIVCDAAKYELDYAVAITPDENSFLDCSLLFKHIKKNADPQHMDSLLISIFQPCNVDTLNITV
jgi:hypothetical protein